MQTFSLDDYRALRERAGTRERDETSRIGVTGKDRLTYLHAMLTNDIAALGPGQGCYSAFLTPQGRMIADMLVVELDDLALIELDAERKAEVLEKLEQFIFSEDVQLHDLSDTLAALSVIGPRSADVLAQALAEGGGPSSTELASLENLRAARGRFRGAIVAIVMSRELGLLAFSVYIDRSRATAFLEAVETAGAVRVGSTAVDVVRLEAGVPRFGVDMDEHTIPLEAGIEHRAISFTKGCYPGQEVIARVLHRGHGRVAKRLVGLVLEGDAVPERGDRLTADGREVGTVTSAVRSPVVGWPIALAYVLRDFAVAGRGVVVEHAGRQLAARVAELPFVQ